MEKCDFGRFLEDHAEDTRLNLGSSAETKAVSRHVQENIMQDGAVPSFVRVVHLYSPVAT
jgi:hypothetical protein